MPKATFAHRMQHWENLIATVKFNQPELADLADLSEQLEVEMEGAKEAIRRQAASRAEAQQATRDLEGCTFRGTDMAHRLRDGIRTQYGFRSEKLTEFGLRPTRNRKTASQEPGSEQPAPTPEQQAPEATAKGRSKRNKKKAPPAATTEVKPQ